MSMGRHKKVRNRRTGPQNPASRAAGGCAEDDHDPAAGAGEDRLDPVELLLAVDGTSSIADLEATHPDQWRIDGRQLTREELRAIHDIQPPDFIRYHLIQDQRNATALIGMDPDRG
ncbi:hypothetical protein [Actinacidiphila oryziradicis]|uniref:Uncharacterized protein n=1 Tax=Actinacidiphila oryziradicis TaxID=2571141 RepID=A0A4U0RMY5_9ACTN|nr:hypothetical protein [Actinacidiphila oryziradicis]TJZ96482.1 hypothetical protein FCI23_50920 [Actinacidiphila oryziradicis]